MARSSPPRLSAVDILRPTHVWMRLGICVSLLTAVLKLQSRYFMSLTMAKVLQSFITPYFPEASGTEWYYLREWSMDRLVLAYIITYGVQIIVSMVGRQVFNYVGLRTVQCWTEWVLRYALVSTATGRLSVSEKRYLEQDGVREVKESVAIIQSSLADQEFYYWQDVCVMVAVVIWAFILDVRAALIVLSPLALYLTVKEVVRRCIPTQSVYEDQHIADRRLQELCGAVETVVFYGDLTKEWRGFISMFTRWQGKALDRAMWTATGEAVCNIIIGLGSAVLLIYMIQQKTFAAVTTLLLVFLISDEGNRSLARMVSIRHTRHHAQSVTRRLEVALLPPDMQERLDRAHKMSHLPAVLSSVGACRAHRIVSTDSVSQYEYFDTLDAAENGCGANVSTTEVVQSTDQLVRPVLYVNMTPSGSAASLDNPPSYSSSSAQTLSSPSTESAEENGLRPTESFGDVALVASCASADAPRTLLVAASLSSLRHTLAMDAAPSTEYVELTTAPALEAEMIWNQVSRVELVNMTWKTVFRGINLAFEPGEKVALMGASGVGKTTLMRVFAGVTQASDGQVLLRYTNGMTSVRPLTWKQLVSLVPQFPEAFSRTLYENITFQPYTQATVEQINRVVAICAGLGMGDVYSSTNALQLDHNLAEQRLSGGQLQLVGLARACFADRPIWVLDEPTSALPSETQRRVLAYIQECTRDRTVLLITHRKEPLELCSRRYELYQDRAECVHGSPLERIWSSL